MPKSFHGLQPDDTLDMKLTSPIKPFTYNVEGKKTLVAYARTALDALELFETANVGLPLSIEHVREETPESMTEWERACCASMSDGRITS